ncbi:MAG: lipopolysaccharide biosynthesis protein [Ignavibacteriaceae bacterium]
MMALIRKNIPSIKSTNLRSSNAKKNILGSLLIKGGNIIISVLYVPLLINSLGKTEFGIWLILSSVISSIGYFDIGIGNGLRNKFAEAKALGERELARIYVSTTYAVGSIIFCSIGFIMSFIIPVLNWRKILNVSSISNKDLVNLVYVVFIFFIVRFIVQLISVVLLSDQRTAFSSVLNLVSNTIILIVILILNKLKLNSLFICSAVLSSVPVVVYIVLSIYLYSFDYRQYRPSISFVRLKYGRTLFNLGLKFLIIQISGLIFYSATNMLITQFYSPDEVTIYNIAYKYFSVSTMLFGIVLVPMWSAITEAYIRNDYDWIKRIMKKLKILAYILSVIVIIMMFYADSVYMIWVGDEIKIPISLSFALGISSIIYLFFSPYSSFLNGVSKIKLNVWLVIGQCISYIPVAYLFTKYLNFGISGIIFAGLLCELPLRISQPIQYNLLINKKASGVWNE